MTTIITIVENDIKAGWTWLQAEFVDGYNVIHSIVGPLIANFAMDVIQDFYGAAVTLVQKLQAALSTPTNLGDLETALLNVVESLGGQLLSTAQAMGSQALQTLLGLLQMKLTPVAAPAAA